MGTRLMEILLKDIELKEKNLRLVKVYTEAVQGGSRGDRAIKTYIITDFSNSKVFKILMNADAWSKNYRLALESVPPARIIFTFAHMSAAGNDSFISLD